MVKYAVDLKNEGIIILPEKTGPGMSILGDLALESIRDQAKYALAHLVSGKNVVFYGAPGTGKTRIAVKLCERICDGFAVETANSEWSNFEIIGGFMPDEKGTPTWISGIFSKAVERCAENLKAGIRPFWLVLDELNRANLDLAFGKIFTLMDIEYRTRSPLPTKNGTWVPLSFRILATMNTYDKALLFSLGYAFMRRFAFIQVPSLLVENKEPDAETDALPPPIPKHLENLRKIIMDAAISQLSLLKESDIALIFSGTFFPVDLRTLNEKVGEKASEANQKITARGIGFMDVLLTVAGCATENGVEMGQALLIDAAKFVISYYLLFPEDSNPNKIIDEAIVAYIVPQLEYFMPQLRKAEIFQEQQLNKKWDSICECVRQFGLPKSYMVLESAKARFRVI